MRILALGCTLPSCLTCPEEQQEAFHGPHTGGIAEPAAPQALAPMTLVKSPAGAGTGTVWTSPIAQNVTARPIGAASNDPLLTTAGTRVMPSTAGGRWRGAMVVLRSCREPS